MRLLARELHEVRSDSDREVTQNEDQTVVQEEHGQGPVDEGAEQGGGWRQSQREHAASVRPLRQGRSGEVPYNPPGRP